MYPVSLGSQGQIGKVRDGGWLINRGDFITKDPIPFDQDGIYEPTGKTHYLGKRMSLEEFSRADPSLFAKYMETFMEKHPDMSSNYAPSLFEKTEKITKAVFDGYKKFEKAESKLEKMYMETTIASLDSQIPGFKHGLDHLRRNAEIVLGKIFSKAEERIERSDDFILDKKAVPTREPTSAVNSIKDPMEHQIEDVRKNPSLLKQVKEQTPELCMAAVSEDYKALSYVREQSNVICLIAVKNDGNALQFVKDQTPQICMEAVKHSGNAIQYVKKQTPELCAEAIKQDPLALKHVKNPSKELCIEAVRSNRNAISFVPESFFPVINQIVPGNVPSKIASKVKSLPSIDLVR